MSAVERPIILLLCLLAGLLPPAFAAWAQPLPPAAPETMGFSPERLRRLDRVIEDYVASGRIPGVVALVAREGHLVHLKAYGHADKERGVPMRTDALFRIASMTKAVTTVAAMMLVEEGTLLLGDPVSKYLPAYAQTFVAIPPPPGAPPATPLGMVPARRAITIRDLMAHTAGISYGAGPLEARYQANGTYLWYCADRDEPIGALVDRLATMPFEAQPGERWVYGFGTDILGRVIEVISGQSLDEFLEQRIFRPLGMHDTHFFVPLDKASRLATVYGIDADGVLVRAPDAGRTGQGEYVHGPRKCLSGGAGLVSTIGDYARFLQMLLDGGTFGGVRLLSPASVALMTSNHVGSLYREGNLGFGLGVEVIEHLGRAGRLGAVGEFTWGSAYYPRFWVDPTNRVVMIMMAQVIPNTGLDLHHKFPALVYQAMVDVPRPADSGRRRVR